MTFTGKSADVRESNRPRGSGLGRKSLLERSNDRTGKVTFTANNCLGMGMTDVIEFLERMGQDAQLRHGSQNDIELAMTEATMAPELKLALLAKNQAKLEMLLGQLPLCAIFLPGKEEEEDDQDESEESPSREPREPRESPEQSRLRTVVAAVD